MSEIPEGIQFIAEAITEQWGERCSDFDPDCACCKSWAAFDALQAERERSFEAIQAAYRRGVDFASEGLKASDEAYVALWEFVPKAAYDYADKVTSVALLPLPSPPSKEGE